MGRVQFPPLGSYTKNIIGTIERYPVAKDSIITKGDFIQFKYEDSKIVVTKADNRFNSGGVAVTDGIYGTNVTIKTVNDRDRMNRLSELNVTSHKSTETITAGDFVKINADSTVSRAVYANEIYGYAIESKTANSDIKIVTVKH